MNAFTCPKCGKITGGSEKFCIDCGQPLNTTCSVCGETWRFMFDYRFCPGCGNSIKKPEDQPAVQQEQSPKKQSKKG